MLSVKHRSAYWRSHVDLARPVPFTTFEVAETPHGTPNFCVDRIVINGPTNDADFAFPDIKAVGGQVNVRDVRDGFFSKLSATSAFMRAGGVREELRRPPGKRRVVKDFLEGIRWRNVEAHDPLYAQTLRDLVPDDHLEHVLDRSHSDEEEPVRRTGFDSLRDHLPHSPIKFRFTLK